MAERAECLAVLDGEDARGSGVMVGARVPQLWDDRLRELAARTNQTVSDLVRDSLRGWLADVMSFGPSDVDELAAEHGLSVAEAHAVSALVAAGAWAHRAVAFVKGERVGAADPAWDPDALSGSTVHRPHAGVAEESA